MEDLQKAQKIELKIGVQMWAFFKKVTNISLKYF